MTKQFLVLPLAGAFSPMTAFAQAVVNRPGGRLAITSDGNIHDKSTTPTTSAARPWRLRS